MEIDIKIEAMPELDSGGGLREVSTIITIDSTQSRRQQRQAVIYETPASHLSSCISHEKIHDLTIDIGEALDQWEGLHETV